MRELKKIILIFFILLFCTSKGYCSTVWINDLRTLFQTNGTIIYAINIRTFNAKDKDNDGIIEEAKGDERGSFLNAIDRLDEMVACGINTIQLLPITPVGKVKALGTAGSLFAASSFNEINPQLKAPNSKLTVYNEMKKFIDECHQRNIRVIVDLPCCGAYDLYLKHPELFKKDKNQKPIIPTDWTDVRLLDAGTDDQINMEVYNLYKNFVDLMISLDVDGIRADQASMKPYSFWKKLIDNTREKNPQFLFLAEASPIWTKLPCEGITATPYNKLLDAGFDGYYGTYSELKNWKTSRELFSKVKSDMYLAKKYKGTKSVLGNFSTHDQISPMLINGKAFSQMIIWLGATLPINTYYIDGFSTGDNYIYFWANKKAAKTFTDDDYYFVHRGQMDIFNFSRKPEGKQYDILESFILANKFKKLTSQIVANGTFETLRTSSPSVFAYERCYDKESVIVIGNLDFKRTQSIVVNVPKIKDSSNSIPIRISSTPILSSGKITTQLAPGDIQVIYFKEPKK